MLLPELHTAAVKYGERLRRGEEEENPPEAQLAVECAPDCLAIAALPLKRVSATAEAPEEAEEVAEEGAPAENGEGWGGSFFKAWLQLPRKLRVSFFSAPRKQGPEI